MTWLHLLLLALFTFRLTLAFSKEGGPAGIFRRTRALLMREVPALKEGITCFWCVSASVGLFTGIVDFYCNGNPVYDIVLVSVALSGAAIILNQQFTADDDNK